MPVPHNILCDKLKKLPLNPTIINIISFLSDRQQRVIVDGVTIEYLNINREVPQGTVIGPTMFSLTVNRTLNPLILQLNW